MGALVKTLKRAVTIDFETGPIRPRPDYPPKPVGLGIRWSDGKTEYVVGMDKMRSRLKKVWASDTPILCHNVGFDLVVAREHLGLPLPDFSRVHDSLPMLFLRNPYAESYALKPSAEVVLKMKPEERDKVLDWLVEHQPMMTGRTQTGNENPHYAKAYEKEPWFRPGTRLNKGAKGDNYAGAYICLAPAELVGPYCIGDVVRTYKLALRVGAHLEKMEMVEAYRREIDLIPVILDMEREGVRVDVKALERDAKLYNRVLLRLDDWIRRRLRCEDLDIDSGAELAKALVASHLATVEDLGTTATGQVCTAKDALKSAITDPQVSAALRYRGAVQTCMRNVIQPWLAMSKTTGRIYATWNTTRRDKSGGMAGARTGRIQPTPNLSNIPKEYTPIFKNHSHNRKVQKTLPRAPIGDLPPPPMARGYFIADEGHVLIDRDFSQQELRILAYFENDVLAQAYRDDPDTDLHQKAADILGVDRYKGKTLNLCIAEGQLVLTSVGLVPIEKVLGSHKLWDGVEWVSHEGLACRGVCEVITHDGVTATPEHEVYTDDGRKIQIREAASEVPFRRLAVGEAAGLPVGYTAFDRKSEERGGLSFCGGGLPSMFSSSLGEPGQHCGRGHEELYVSARLQGSAVSDFGKAVSSYGVALHQALLQVMAEVWWSWHQSSFQIEHRVHPMGFAALAGFGFQGGGYRPHQQRRALLEGQLATSNAVRESSEPRKARVYDLMNAGPRNRFTVSGRVVSNSIIYGMGLGLLAERLSCTVDEARALKARYFKEFYSVKDLLRSITQASQSGHPVSTWGGRKYYAEDPKIVQGRLQTYEYKLCNYLIQGSAADITKSSMIEFRRRCIAEGVEAHLRATVHDELLASARKDHAERAMQIMKEVMAMPRLDVPMTSTGEKGPSWGSLEEVG